MIQMNLFTNRLTDIENKLIVTKEGKKKETQQGVEETGLA